MARELNKNEFWKVAKGYENASELYEQGLYKEALLELKPAFRLLERDAIKTRMLAKCYVLRAQIYEKQNKPAADEWKKARETLEDISDKSELYLLAKEKADA